MSLYLYELVPADTTELNVPELVGNVDKTVRGTSAEVIESQVTSGHERVFVIVEARDQAALDGVLDAATLGVSEITGPDEVRLVGAELADVKATRPDAGYLVEWDFPEGLDMETYLARKKANAPKYAEVPEVSFLRTYVREDMEKCVCLYDAPDEGVVRQARAAVSTPIDRLHHLDQPEEA